MTDKTDGARAPVQTRNPSDHPTYDGALAVVARHHGIDLELLHGSSDQTRAPNEDVFYLQLARALLFLAAHDHEWASPRAIAAISAIDVATPQEAERREKERSERGPLIAGKRAFDVLRNAAKRSVAAATDIVKKSGIPAPGRGRPAILTRDGQRIADIMTAAKVSYSRPWPNGWSKLESYLQKKAQELPTAAKRSRYKKEMNDLIGRRGARAREVYRTIKNHQERSDDFLAQMFAE